MIVATKVQPVKVIDCTDTTDTIDARLQERDTWLDEFNAGQAAFRSGEFPSRDWTAGKISGWNFAGELLNLAATSAPSSTQKRWAAQEECEYLPLSDEPGYLESSQPWLY